MNKKVYIGTLFVGENEIEECKNSVKKQTFLNIKHEIFSYLPNKQAHDTLYSRFMELQNDYDYFIKLDADMVFVDENVVKDIVDIFEKNDELSHCVFTVHDWYTDSPIIGIHCFDNRVKWNISNDLLFVDHNPQTIGKKKTFLNHISLAYHSPNPSYEEAYLFGYHRALKIVQKDRIFKNILKAYIQFEILKKVWNRAKTFDDKRILAVLIGAEKSFNGLDSIMNKSFNTDELRLICEKIKINSYDELFLSIKSNWEFFSLKSIRRFIMYYYIPKIIIFPAKLLRNFYRKIKF